MSADNKPESNTNSAKNTAKAIFAAGCFWGVEAEFRKIEGVTGTTVGYTGGHFKNPSYQDVCSDKTGHAEAVLVEYDTTKVSYEKLLDVFWEIHDPTTRNRQGPDMGSQYRSEIFFYAPEQKKAALVSRNNFQSKLAKPIVTHITPAGVFCPAEEYHQRYLEKHGKAACHTGLK